MTAKNCVVHSEEPVAKRPRKDVIMKAVVDDSWTQPVNRISVYIGRIENKRLVSSIIKAVNQLAPIPSLKHLRRVRQVEGDAFEIILTEAKPDAVHTSSPHILGGVALEGLAQEIRVTEVPGTQPKTRSQYEEAKNLWPTNFHEDKYMEKLLSCDVFSPVEIENLKKVMRLVRSLSESSGYSAAAVIFDPRTAVVVAQGVDSRDRHPLKHSVITVLENVAEFQRSCPPSDSDVYLCTGYDAFLSREPCVMCAMALLHSRIKRVFYDQPRPSGGGLGSFCKIHCYPLFNHHFEVFRGFPHDFLVDDSS